MRWNSREVIQKMSDNFFKGEGEQGLTLLVIKWLLPIHVCFSSAEAEGVRSLWVEIQEIYFAQSCLYVWEQGLKPCSDVNCALPQKCLLSLSWVCSLWILPKVDAAWISVLWIGSTEDQPCRCSTVNGFFPLMGPHSPYLFFHHWCLGEDFNRRHFLFNTPNLIISCFVICAGFCDIQEL